MSRVVAPALALVVVGFSFSASAEVVRERISLPLNGFPVDLASLVEDLEGPVRIVFSGTLSSSLDGSTIDAMGRGIGERWFETEGPFVRLPPGARLVEHDPTVHRYVFEAPTDGPLPVALHLAPLAARHLVTASEMESSCTGAIEIEVVGVRSEPVVTTASGKMVGTIPDGPSISPMAVSLGAAAIVLLLIGGFVKRRVNRRPEAGLIRRCRAAHRAVENEARELGPAFGYVIAASAELKDAAFGAKAHLVSLRTAAKSTGRLQAARAMAKREELVLSQTEALDRMKGIAERLENAAAELASYRVQQSRVPHLDEIATHLVRELETAVAATEEAGLSRG